MLTNKTYEEIINKTITDGKSITELLTYNGVCYWCFIDKLIYDSLNLKKVIFANSKLIRSLLCVIYSYIPVLLLLYVSTAYVVWNLISASSVNKLINNNSKNTLLYRMRFLDWREEQSDSKRRLKDVYHNTIINHLQKNIQIVETYELQVGTELSYKSILRYLDIKKNGIHGATFSVPTIVMWNPTIWYKQLETYYHFKNIWSTLQNADPWFNTLSNASGINVKTIKTLFKSYILYALPTATQNKLLYERLITRTHSLGYVLQDEQSPNGRILQAACFSQKIPSVVLQHGEHVMQNGSYSQRCVVESNIDRDVYFPLPTKMCVWGKHGYQRLVDVEKYPPNSVVITGNQRYDPLADADVKYSRQKFCNTYHINTKSKIILWITQSHGWAMDENKLYFEEVFRTCSNMPNITLIIKQHPSEGAIYTKLIETYCIKYNLGDKVIVPNKLADTTEMVYISDIVITKHSTTGQEAVIFHKPMIVMDYSSNPDEGSYVKEGVAIPAYDLGVLETLITEILQNKYHLMEAQDKYIENYLYRIDGKATERISKLIIQSVDQNNNI